MLSILLYILPVGAVLSQCSTQNTGGEHFSYHFMSNGKCSDYCRPLGFPVAIVSGYDCWCSDSVPQQTSDSSNCETVCPGYGPEDCAGNGFYGYILIGTPSSTVGRSSTVEKSSSTQSTDLTTLVTKTTELTRETTVITSTQVVQSTIDGSSTTSSSSSSSSSSTSSSTSTSSSSSSSSSSTSTSSSPTSPSVTTVVSIMTVGGSATPVTTYVTATPSSSPSPSPSSTSKSFFDSKGKVAGTFTAVGIVVVGILAMVLYCCCFGGAAATEDHDDYTDEELRYSSDESPQKQTPEALKRNSSSKSMFSVFNIMDSETVARSMSRKKLSKEPPGDAMMFPITELDNRLDPQMMFMNSNVSGKSLNDDADYSRKLKVVN